MATAEMTSEADIPAGTIICPPVLDLAYAPELKAALLRALSDGGDVQVRAHAVTHVDTASLQLLCAAALEVARSGHTLTIAEPSEALTRIARRLGLVTVLGTSNPECWAGAADPARSTSA